MKISRTHAGAAAFVLALMLGAVAGSLFYTPDVAPRSCGAPRVPTAIVVHPPAPPRPEASATISANIELITLDSVARKVHTTLELEHDPDGPAPASVWVRTYFSNGCASEAVELRWPSADARRVTLTSSAPLPACLEPLDSDANYYASIYTSTTRPAELLNPSDYVSLGPPSAVTVEWGARLRRPTNLH